MEKKIVLVTGGSSGIGRSVGNYLSEKGYKVYGTTRSLEKQQDFKDFRLLELDVRKPDTIQKALDRLLDEEGRLDVLINNAGVGITGPLEETPNEAILNAFETNFTGPLNLMKAVLPIMRRQGSGRVINITSIAGKMGLPYRGVYSASKGALDLATEALRLEVRDFGILISTLAPGDFKTNIAAGRFHAPLRPDSPYHAPYEATLKMINDHVDQAGDPVQVAEKVFAILRDPSPKVHYKVGSFMQRLSVVLKRLLPGKLYERLLRNHYKL
ncbi:Short-chain dehydrogenase [Muriicola jejuensis]|uniref:SDR family NAD(P)-dependent oxidoreductase n=1 Tax=Muriicola jejuensis TaxID=504488 RepID=A0A6P0UCU0_9FLAO|nr:SDR family oxidoreductase [Muriicola jejuensis]NER11101.1 SDR family NAD(P)-dependent oxidoreductase [Muriicola jejuensis]SMP23737.1 Short-chain dehydrogenase [Muriicola jejuensis]